MVFLTNHYTLQSQHFFDPKNFEAFQRFNRTFYVLKMVNIPKRQVEMVRNLQCIEVS